MFLLNFDKDVYHISVKEAEEFLVNFNYSSVSQQNQIISSVKHLYVMVVGRKLKTLNIVRPRKEKKLPKIIDAELLAEKINAIPNLKHKSILALGLSCGLRISEVINLKWDDLDRAKNTLTVINGKGRKDRNTKLNNDMIDLLSNYWKEYKSKEYVFNGQFKNQYSASSIQRVVKKYIHPKASFHLLRHSHSTYAIDNGTPLPVLQKELGHTSPTTTSIYLHLSTKSLNQLQQAI
jgi:integrase